MASFTLFTCWSELQRQRHIDEQLRYINEQLQWEDLISCLRKLNSSSGPRQCFTSEEAIWRIFYYGVDRTELYRHHDIELKYLAKKFQEVWALLPQRLLSDLYDVNTISEYRTVFNGIMIEVQAQLIGRRELSRFLQTVESLDKKISLSPLCITSDNSLKQLTRHAFDMVLLHNTCISRQHLFYIKNQEFLDESADFVFTYTRLYFYMYHILYLHIPDFVFTYARLFWTFEFTRTLVRYWNTFTEWPGGGRRTNGTTWPWSIKISLMVLWGVCWMFYGSPNTIANNDLSWLGEGWDTYGKDKLHLIHLSSCL